MSVVPSPYHSYQKEVTTDMPGLTQRVSLSFKRHGSCVVVMRHGY